VVTSNPGHFPFSARRPVFQGKSWRQDRFRATIANAVDLEHPPFGPAFGMTTERRSSRAVDHRLDEPRQIIPQHGCVPAAPASVSPGAVIVPAQSGRANREGVACCRRIAVAGELVPTYDRAPHESPPVAPRAYLAASHGSTMLQPVCS
jgi:hypothetical protein